MSELDNAKTHVVLGTGNPSAAPTERSQHYINTSTKKTWLSKGTDSVADWGTPLVDSNTPIPDATPVKHERVTYLLGEDFYGDFVNVDRSCMNMLGKFITIEINPDSTTIPDEESDRVGLFIIGSDVSLEIQEGSNFFLFNKTNIPITVAGSDYNQIRQPTPDEGDAVIVLYPGSISRIMLLNAPQWYGGTATWYHDGDIWSHWIPS